MMGARKRNRAEKLKEERKKQYFAVLNGCPVAPRKMRLVADQVRGKEVNNALDILRFNPKAASSYLEKLLLSAISNWQNKNEGVRIEDSNLIVSEVQVNPGRTLKRIRPEAMGRAHLIRKRSNHVKIWLKNLNETAEEPEKSAPEKAENTNKKAENSTNDTNKQE
jgi:large subunit ribosomal protein L22